MRKEWAVDEEEGGIGDGVACQSTQAPHQPGNKLSKHEPVRPFKIQTVVYSIWLGNKNKAILTDPHGPRS